MNASICTGHRAAWAAAHGVAPLTRQMMCRGRPTTMFFGSTGWVGRLCAFRAEAGGLGSRPGRLLSGAPGEGGGGGGAKSGMVDVQGGKVEDTSRAEGHLVWAERVKNIVAAHRRFQLTTYNRLPEDHNDQSSIHTDSQRTAVTGLLHKEKQNLVILLRNNQPSHQQHKDNASRMASASVAVGHLDPVQLVPVFTRVGLMPPVVRLVGDLVPIQPQYDEELRAAMGVGQDAGSLYWLEPAGIFFEDIFSERTQVSVRDFRSAFVDPLALQQMEAIHVANTEFFDYLPKFCRDFLGVPVEEAFLYSVDRAGFSLFALRDGTDDKWREYRFPFQAEVKKYDGFLQIMTAMKGEVDAAEAKLAEDSKPKKAHKSKRNK